MAKGAAGELFRLRALAAMARRPGRWNLGDIYIIIVSMNIYYVPLCMYRYVYIYIYMYMNNIERGRDVERQRER